MADSEPWICWTCGGHFPPAVAPPEADCFICADERQWVPPTGQRWTTPEELGAEHRSDLREIEPGLVGIGVTPPFAIGQRGVLVRTAEGNLLWDPPGYFDQAAVQKITELGGLRHLSASHPHMYGAMVALAELFDAEIVLPEADVSWLPRPSSRVRTWSGSLDLLPGVTLVQCGGHFPGSSAAHWAHGAGGAGALFVGDTMHVTPGEDRITYAWSAPNRLPMPERGVRGIVDALRPYDYDRVYTGWWGPAVRRDAQRIVAASTERYLQFLRGEVPLS